jgi:hypothetical protein
MFEAVATAKRKGKAGICNRRVSFNTNGTMTRHTMSLTRKADKISE